MGDIVQQFKQWVWDFLAKPHAATGGLPVCPYAKDALLRERLRILVCNSNLEQTLDEAMQAFLLDRKETVVIAPIGVRSAEELDALLDLYREKYFLNDAWLLLDDPQTPEEEGLFNFKQATLFIVQSFTGLMKATEELQQRGYYQTWSTDYYDTVVGRRQAYFQRYLEHQKADVAVAAN